MHGRHCTHVRSLPVSTIEVNFCAGVPMEMSTRYSPLPADTGLWNAAAPTLANTCFARDSCRAWPLFTASMKISPVVFAVADLSGEEGCSLWINSVIKPCQGDNCHVKRSFFPSAQHLNLRTSKQTNEVERSICYLRRQIKMMTLSATC